MISGEGLRRATLVASVRTESEIPGQIYFGDERTLGSGFEGSVYLANVALANMLSARRLQLARKVLDVPESAPLLMQRYQVARAAGMQVPQTFRILREETGELSILMTDQSEGGVNLLIEPGDAGLRQMLRQRPDLQRRVRSLDFRLRDDVGKRTALGVQLEDMSAQANRSGVLLSEDAVRLVVNPRDELTLTIADFGFFIPGEANAEGGYTYSVKGPGNWEGGYASFSLTANKLAAYNARELEAFRRDIRDYQHVT